MLFTEFVQNLGFDRDIAQAKLVGKSFPLVSNAGDRIMQKLRSTLNEVFADSNTSRRFLDLCSLKRMPTDLSYYLVDSISVRSCDGEV